MPVVRSQPLWGATPALQGGSRGWWPHPRSMIPPIHPLHVAGQGPAERHGPPVVGVALVVVWPQRQPGCVERA